MYEIEDYLTGSCVLLSYDKQHIESLLSMLTPENVGVVLLSKRNENLCDRIEKWFGTKYGVYDLPKVMSILRIRFIG